MTPFEFVCAFYSVILGVAVAQLMTSVGRLIEMRDQVRTYWVQSVWVVIVLLIDINCWWSMWDLRDAKTWRFISFLLLVGLVASLYLVTILLFPRFPEGGARVDLDAHYYRNRAFFFVANAVGWLFGLFCNLTFLPIDNWLNPGIVLPLVAVPLLIVAAFTKNRRYHAVMAILFLIAVSLVLSSPKISIE